MADHINPGELEVITGPMKSKKSARFMMRVDDIACMRPLDVLIAKPLRDTRSSAVWTRFGELSYDHECFPIDEYQPQELLRFVSERTKVVAIDEVQLFDRLYEERPDEFLSMQARLSFGIEGAILELLRRDINVILAGLDTSFRGEQFKCMSYFLSIAQLVDKRAATCDYVDNGQRCNKKAFWTQRLLNDSPAPYTDPLIYVEMPNDVDELNKRTYEARCTAHHFVPGRPL